MHLFDLICLQHIVNHLHNALEESPLHSRNSALAATLVKLRPSRSAMSKANHPSPPVCQKRLRSAIGLPSGPSVHRRHYRTFSRAVVQVDDVGLIRRRSAFRCSACTKCGDILRCSKPHLARKGGEGAVPRPKQKTFHAWKPLQRCECRPAEVR